MTWPSNTPSSLDDIRRQHCSLAILRALLSCSGDTSNDAILRDHLGTFGLLMSRDHLRTILRGLEEKGAVTLRWHEGCAIASLTRTGAEVAAGTVVMDGVLKPDAECPY